MPSCRSCWQLVAPMVRWWHMVRAQVQQSQCLWEAFLVSLKASVAVPAVAVALRAAVLTLAEILLHSEAREAVRLLLLAVPTMAGSAAIAQDAVAMALAAPAAVSAAAQTAVPVAALAAVACVGSTTLALELDRAMAAAEVAATMHPAAAASAAVVSPGAAVVVDAATVALVALLSTLPTAHWERRGCTASQAASSLLRPAEFLRQEGRGSSCRLPVAASASLQRCPREPGASPVVELPSCGATVAGSTARAFSCAGAGDAQAPAPALRL
eukprot:TRINITY_DN1712_c3_g1_i2.p2 TRINITY_DN1712_c3_g1~~TRINITY_DN1712_c3_g1_i2.p2  ORF type:complete len:270 (-),score=54.11 TRINITY_DN1712_c3_g1_i2:157-966(-)